MTTQAATRSFKEVFPKVCPPSSPFSELLRQSKFAKFDPCIRQAYSAPPSYTQRGNFGLKRPISNRKSHAYIVLKDFEEHAQYIQWDNAKEQVKWMKQVEELYVAPQLKTFSTWTSGLGPSATSKESGLDSEFCPGETALIQRNKPAEVIDPNPKTLDQVASAEDSTLLPEDTRISAETLLPSRGKGGYGAKADIQSADALGKMFLQPNISAMTSAVFRRYLQKLRKLRPEFIAYVREELRKLWVANKNNSSIPIDPRLIPDEDLIATLGPLILDHKFHLRFMGLKTEAEYHTEPVAELFSDKERAKLEQDAVLDANRPQPIRPQPHKFAGLMYAQPTPLESRFINKPQPGIFLEQTPNQVSSSDRYIASFAGIAAQFKHLGLGAKPVFEPRPGANLDNLPQGTRLMSPTNITLAAVPTVVGRSAPSKPLPYVQMRVTVADDVGVSKNHIDNPHTPGSFEYNSLRPVSTRATFTRMRIPDRAHARGHSWVDSRYTGSMLYDFSSKDWNSMRETSVFDPKSTSPQFRRLDYEKTVKDADTVTKRVVGSMLKRANRKDGSGKKEPTDP